MAKPDWNDFVLVLEQGASAACAFILGTLLEGNRCRPVKYLLDVLVQQRRTLNYLASLYWFACFFPVGQTEMSFDSSETYLWKLTLHFNRVKKLTWLQFFRFWGHFWWRLIKWAFLGSSVWFHRPTFPKHCAKTQVSLSSSILTRYLNMIRLIKASSPYKFIRTLETKKLNRRQSQCQLSIKINYK